MAVQSAVAITKTYDYEAEAQKMLDRIIGKTEPPVQQVHITAEKEAEKESGIHAVEAAQASERLEIALKKQQEDVKEKCWQSLKKTLKELEEAGEKMHATNGGTVNTQEENFHSLVKVRRLVTGVD